ncbi:arsenite methyltransferase [Candidatus Kapaibacterium sp.]
MIDNKNDLIRASVRKNYANVALNVLGGNSCCSPSNNIVSESSLSLGMGYSDDDVKFVPEGANMGLGCGNPRAIASLKTGEYVLDLGSGGGFDAFLCSKEVGKFGKVIGVDMTPDMVSKARNNVIKGGFTNVEFRLGEIENLPISDNYVDVIISNCVINLSPEKQRVFDECFRVLKKGGRLAISDVVASGEIPEKFKSDLFYHSACISGASTVLELKNYLLNSGFDQIKIEPKEESKEFMKEWVPNTNISDFVISAYIEAYKP